MYLKAKYKDIHVSYQWKLNGGGIIFAHEYVRLVKQKYGRIGHVFEFCAGPGFIGFALLAHGLCDRLTLADINPQAVLAIKDTIKNNQLEDRVTVYQSDGLKDIPHSEQWDLVVGNPPWWISQQDRGNIRLCDPKGMVHEDFFQRISAYLKPQGHILLVEGAEYSNPWHFQQMISKNSLCLTESFQAVKLKDFFRSWGDYQGIRLGMIFFVRLCLYVRQVYFLSIKPSAQTMLPGQVNDPFLWQIRCKYHELLRVYVYMLISYLLLWTPVGSLPVFMFWVWATFLVLQVGIALDKRRPEYYCYAMVFPIIKLIVPLILLWQSSRRLNAKAEKLF